MGKFFAQELKEMYDENGNPIEVANRPQSIVYIKMDQPIEKDTFLRQERK